MRRPAGPGVHQVRSATVTDREVLPRVCASNRAICRAGSGSAIRPPEAYTPKHLAEKILTSKAALEGERKQVTVLFADLKGSMELLADQDPEEARKLLDPVLERMMEAVHRYEGTVNQVMGDGIMALFGAPLAHEDHAVRACYAALRMQESVKRYAEEVRRSHAAVVKVRVGLNSGEVVVRAIGSDLRMDYTGAHASTPEGPSKDIARVGGGGRDQGRVPRRAEASVPQAGDT
jgi:class 3 adenylate cyclase